MNVRAVESTSTHRPRSSRTSTARQVEGPHAADHGELQDLADDSSRVAGLASLQDLADASPQVAAQRHRQTLAARGSAAPVQAKLAGAPVAAGSSSAQRGGLPGPLRAKMERSFGASFADVSVRTDSSKASSRGALAVTERSQIDFAPGQFEPSSRAGQALIGHELTHVLQQRAGRVDRAQSKASRSPLEQELDIDHDPACEREADELGLRAARGEMVRVPGAPPEPRPGEGQGGGAIQPKLGFELEMLVLIDDQGRPVPEKTEVGKFGTHVNLDVDQGAEVEAITPALPETSNFDIPDKLEDTYTGSYRFQDIVKSADPNKADTITNYDHATLDEAVADDTLWGLLVAQRLEPLVFKYMEGIAKIQAGKQDYAAFKGAQGFGDLFELVRNAVDALQGDKRAALLAEAANNEDDPKFKRKNRQARMKLSNPNVRKSLKAVLTKTEAELVKVANNQLRRKFVQASLSTTFKQKAAPHAEVEARVANDDDPGMGGVRYASILELVTDAHDPETASGREKVFKSLEEAAELAALIEAAGPGSRRVQLNTLSNKLNVHDDYYIGNPRSKQQTTDASIQSTFGLDLAQLASYIKTTMDPQVQPDFRSKHDADQSNLEGTAMVFRAEKEIRAAVDDASAILNDAAFVNPPDLPNLRGLLILMCQYLRLGKHSYNGGEWTYDEDDNRYFDDSKGQWTLDKNMTALLSRTDLAKIREAMPAGEKTWLDTNKATLAARLLTRTEREASSTVITDIKQSRDYREITTTVEQFIDNVFEADADGMTGNFGGFHTMNAEEIHPHRPASNKAGPVFELRNLVPSTGLSERFPYSEWLGIGTTIANVLYVLHRRTDAQAMTDVQVKSLVDIEQEPASWKA